MVTLSFIFAFTEGSLIIILEQNIILYICKDSFRISKMFGLISMFWKPSNIIWDRAVAVQQESLWAPYCPFFLFLFLFKIGIIDPDAILLVYSTNTAVILWLLICLVV